MKTGADIVRQLIKDYERQARKEQQKVKRKYEKTLDNSRKV